MEELYRTLGDAKCRELDMKNDNLYREKNKIISDINLKKECEYLTYLPKNKINKRFLLIYWIFVV